MVKETVTRMKKTMKNVNNGSFFEYEDSLRELFASIGGVPKNFGKFELDIAECATHLQPRDDGGDSMSFVLSIFEKMNALKRVYTSVNGTSEGFWNFVEKIAAITGSVLPPDSDDEIDDAQETRDSDVVED